MTDPALSSEDLSVQIRYLPLKRSDPQVCEALTVRLGLGGRLGGLSGLALPCLSTGCSGASGTMGFRFHDAQGEKGAYRLFVSCEVHLPLVVDLAPACRDVLYSVVRGAVELDVLRGSFPPAQHPP